MTKKEQKIRLDSIISDLASFLEKEFSSQFKTLSQKEDRQLFFLARILTKLKSLREEVKETEKIVSFPTLQKIK